MALADGANKDSHLKKAKTVFEKNRSKKITDIYRYWEARYLLSTGQFGASRKVIDKHIAKYDSLAQECGKFYNLLGSMFSLERDYKSAILYFQKTIAIYEHHDQEKNAAFIKSNVANIFFSLSDYESAYKYLDEAHTTLASDPDSVYFPTIIGLLSVSEVKLKNMKSAKKHALEALSVSENLNHAQAKSLAHYALGEIALEEKKLDAAIIEFTKAQSVAVLAHDANMTHLTNVSLLTALTEKGDFKAARTYGETAFKELSVVPNTTAEYSIRKNLSKAYAGLGDFKNAYYFGRTADSLYKETASIENKEYINNLLIKYETAQKESDLLIEQQKNLTNQIQLRKQGWFMFALTLSLVLAILVFFIARNYQKNKLKTLSILQEKSLMRAVIDGEERERKRLASELHDGLASDLTGIKMMLNQHKDVSQKVLDALTNAHENTRRISHNMSPLHLEQLGLIGALNAFVQENSSEQMEIRLFALAEHIDLGSPDKNLLAFRMCQEFVQNAQKHSSATETSLQLSINHNDLNITIEDNGKGFNPSETSTSFGLSNAKSQVALLNGEINIDSSLGNGTVILISIPIS